MSTMMMPGFTAEGSFYRSSAHYQVGAMLAGLRQVGEVLMHPALKKSGRSVFFCAMKGCCLDLGSFGTYCCTRDFEECGGIEVLG
jgi:hypothetical protein